jgi:hypothetical protein
MMAYLYYGPSQHKYPTMASHPHITLIVPQQLDSAARKSWMATAVTNLPSGVHASATVSLGGEQRDSRGYARRMGDAWHYVIPTARDLLLPEAERIAQAWAAAQPDGDFEIDYSSGGEADPRHHEIKTNGLRELALAAARAYHARSVSEQSGQGWSYGTGFDRRSKKSPMMVPWENLSSRYKLGELRRFEALLEILDQMDLRLARKRR